MRSPLKTLLGVALAIGVALSASPAVAVTGPLAPPSPDALIQDPANDPSATEPGETAPEGTEPNGETPRPDETGPDPADPGGAGTGEGTLPVDPEDSEGEGDPAERETAPAGELPTEDDDAAEAESELLTEVPEILPVSGTLAIVSSEGAHPGFGESAWSTGGSAEPEEEHEGAELTPGRVLVATDSGPLVEIDPALVGAEALSGDRFEGTLTLDATAQAAVEAEISESGPVAVEDAIEAATQAEAGAGPVAGVVGSALPNADVAAAPAKKSHGVDLIFFTGGGNPSDASLKKLVADTSIYWNGQSNGAISGMPLSAQKRKAPTGNSRTLRCDARYTDNLWTQGARAFGKNPDSYLKSGRHLVVVVDDDCGALSGNVAGWGTIGSLHSGGLVWIDTGVRDGGDVSLTTGLLAHEIGHNLGLGHGNSRICTGNDTDAQMRNGRPVSPCWDDEYGDVYNVMGKGSSFGGSKPVALAISQKHQLGIAPAGSVRTVQASGGRSQTFTLQPGGGNSGLRGLKVESPTGGTFYVEYRNRTGQDAGFYTVPGASYYYYGLNYHQERGVRVLKPFAQGYGASAAKASTVIPIWDTVSGTKGRFQTMRAGTNSTPWYNTARVSVVSVGSTAVVRVDFTPFIDVPYAHKFGKEINWMSSAKLSTGINAGGSLRKYDPKSNVTREAMAAFLYRLEAPKNYQAPKKSPFTDVPTSHKFYKEIAWMYTSGLSTGIKTAGGRTYAPKSSVTREAMAAFIYRLEGSRYAGAKTSPFADMKPGQKFYKEVTWMYSSGLSTGINKNGKRIYNPKGKVTREAMAAFIYRLKH